MNLLNVFRNKDYKYPSKRQHNIINLRSVEKICQLYFTEEGKKELQEAGVDFDPNILMNPTQKLLEKYNPSFLEFHNQPKLPKYFFQKMGVETKTNFTCMIHKFRHIYLFDFLMIMLNAGLEVEFNIKYLKDNAEILEALNKELSNQQEELKN